MHSHLCMVTARSFAMAFNRLADRQLDAANPRTAGRHLPAGLLSVPQVTLFAVALCRWLRRQHALVPAEPLAACICRCPCSRSWPATVSPSDSRRSPTSGSARRLRLSPVAAWIAIRGDNVLAHPADLLPALVLGGAVLLGSPASTSSTPARTTTSIAQPGCTACPSRSALPARCAGRRLPPAHDRAAGLPAAGLSAASAGSIWAGIAAVAVLLIYEHLLVRPDDLSRVNAAFFNVNAVISIGLFVVGSLDLLVHRVGY